MPTYISEEALYRENVIEIQDGEPVDGGSDGPVNIQAKNLADRTAYLKIQADALRANIGTYTNPQTIAVRLDGIDAELDSLADEIGGLGDSLEPRVAALEGHVGVYTDLDTIAARLDALEGTLGEMDNYDDTAIKARVTAVEGRAGEIETDIGVYTNPLSIAARLNTLEGASGYDETALAARVSSVEGDIGVYPGAGPTIAIRLNDIEGDIGNYTNAQTIAARLDALSSTVSTLRSGLVVTAGNSIYRRPPNPMISVSGSLLISTGGFSYQISSTPVAKGGNDTILLSSSTQDDNTTYGVIGIAYRMECFGSVNMLRDLETDSGDTYAVYKNGVLVESGQRADGNPFGVTVTGIVPGDVITAMSSDPMLNGQFKVGITALT